MLLYTSAIYAYKQNWAKNNKYVLLLFWPLLGIYQSKKDLMKIFEPECDKEFSQK